MFKEMITLMINSLVFSVGTSLALAPLFMLAARRLARLSVGFMLSYIICLLVDVCATWFQIVVVMSLGYYLPPVTNVWGSWLLQAAILVAAGWLLLPLLLRPASGAAPSGGRRLKLCLALAALILLKNAVILYVMMTFFMPQVPGVG